MNPWHLSKIHSWYEQPTGRWVLEQERVILKRFWPQCFGQYLLELGLSPKILELSVDAGLREKINLTPFVSNETSIVGTFDNLPIASDSMDAVLVHHCLGFLGDPLTVLKEIYRVLLPEGRVVICGLRPWWFYSAYDQFHHQSQFPWSLRSASVWQVNKWLSEVGLVTDTLVYHSQGLSLYKNSKQIHHSTFLQRLARFGLPFGSGYILFAQKRVASVTPIKLEWAMRGKLANYREGKPITNR